MARLKVDAEIAVEMDMTPIIDVVFNLVIFFMLTANLSQAAVETLKLPKATEVNTKVKMDALRLIVNINEKGEVKVAGQLMTDNALIPLLRIEADQERDPTNPKLSNKAVLIRADQNTKYDDVQKVMQLCTQVGIWKLEFAAVKPQ
ncbi:MAG: biopolymer transporter ExbD [Planctomycetota bacterium]